ncbi:MAG: hypothetical protein V1872_15065 [bacterium]
MIPFTIWLHSSIKLFIQKLQSVEPSATIFKGGTGVWKKEKEEDISIYRMILRSDDFDRSNVESMLHSEVGDLMAKLSGWSESSQKAVMVTQTEI